MRTPEYPEKTSDDELQKMPRTKARRFKSQDLKPHNSIGDRLGNRRDNRYTACRPHYTITPHVVILTLAVGHKFTRKENFLASMKFSHTFQLNRIKTDVVLKQFKMNIFILI